MSTALDEPAGKPVLPARGRIDEQLIHQFLDLGLGIDELAQVATATQRIIHSMTDHSSIGIDGDDGTRLLQQRG